MKRKTNFVDRLQLTGNIEQDRMIAKERLERLKLKDYSFMEYGLKKQTLKTKFSKWIKTKIKMLLNKVCNK